MLKPFLVSLEFLLFELFFHDLSTWSFPSLSFWIFFFFLLWKNFKLRKVTIGQGIPIYLLLTCQYFATFALSFLVCVYVCACAYLSELSWNSCTYHVPSPHNIEAYYKKASTFSYITSVPWPYLGASTSVSPYPQSTFKFHQLPNYGL